MKRGEVWWVDLPAPAGRRPAVLLSRDSAYRVRAAITVAPVTRTIRNIPVEVILDRSDGMPARCVVNLDDITTLPKILIRQRITALSTEKIRQVDQAIRFALDLDW
jgi:mRNA interferase MazF